MDPTVPAREWPGYSKLKHVFVFGDSYSSIGFESIMEIPKPTEEESLGLPLPADTVTEKGKPNWVGHLVSKYRKSPFLAYDYAIPGHVVYDLFPRQVKPFLEHYAGNAKPWTTSDSLFCTWIGFNDVGRLATAGTPADDSLKTLFTDIQEKLYAVGARNFALFTVPPFPRNCPYQHEGREEKREEWNQKLPQYVKEFTDAHPEASVFVFDADALFVKMGSEPASFGLAGNAGESWDMQIYMDEIHPTTKAHQIVAREFARFLAGKEVPEVGE